MMVLVVVADGELRNHLVRALTEHARWCRTNGLAVPPELSRLLDLLASDGHSRPHVGDVADLGDSAVVQHLALDYDAVAVRLGVSERTVRRLVARGDLPAIDIAGCRRIRAADLATYVDGFGEAS